MEFSGIGCPKSTDIPRLMAHVMQLYHHRLDSPFYKITFMDLCIIGFIEYTIFMLNEIVVEVFLPLYMLTTQI